MSYYYWLFGAIFAIAVINLLYTLSTNGATTATYIQLIVGFIVGFVVLRLINAR
jgi:multisubunit Na+/H+ antiporter MnhE subunit